MKCILFITAVCSLCVISCKKDDNLPEAVETRLSKFQILTKYYNGATSSNWILELSYDKSGRISEINNHKYHYGVDGKVDYSRLALGDNVERYSYRWDERGRLKEVYLDSLYRKGSTDFNDYSPGILLKDILISSYIYDTNGIQPSKIIYKKLVKDFGIYLQGTAEEEEVNYNYKDENIIQSKVYQFLDKQNGINNGIASDYTIFSYHQYSNYINPLYPIYKQLGFHPLDFNQAMSRNIESTYYSYWSYHKTNYNSGVDWSRGEQVETILGTDGKPSQVNAILSSKGEKLGKIEYNYRYKSNIQKEFN